MGFIKINEIIVMKPQQLGLVCCWTSINASDYYLLWLPRVWQGSLIEGFVMREVICVCAAQYGSHCGSWALKGGWCNWRTKLVISFHFNSFLIEIFTYDLWLICWTTHAGLFRLHPAPSITCLCSCHVQLLVISISTQRCTRTKRGCETWFWQVGMVA